MAKDAAPAAPPTVRVLRMRPALAAQLLGKALGLMPSPVGPPLTAGTRVLLVEFNGGQTGRADLVTIEGRHGDAYQVRRAWSWHKGKMDSDLSALGYAAVEDDSPILEAL